MMNQAYISIFLYSCCISEVFICLSFLFSFLAFCANHFKFYNIYNFILYCHTFTFILNLHTVIQLHSYLMIEFRTSNIYIGTNKYDFLPRSECPDHSLENYADPEGWPDILNNYFWLSPKNVSVEAFRPKNNVS